MPSEFSQFQPANPFLSDLAPDGLEEFADSIGLHGGVLEDLGHLVEWARRQTIPGGAENHGQAVLIRAPRAGFGKTHLLGLLRSRLEAAGGAFVIPLRFDLPEAERWESVLRQIGEHWHLSPAGPGVILRDLERIARRAFAALNAVLIRQGLVPCAQPEQALRSLEGNYAALFDFADPGQAVGQWFQHHFKALLSAGLPHLAVLCGQPEGMLGTCLSALCAYAQGAAEQDGGRLEAFFWALRQPSDSGVGAGKTQPPLRILTAPPRDGTFHRSAVLGLCSLAALCRPLVLILDHLDGFHQQTEQLLSLGRWIADWRRSNPRSLLVLSVNEDLWTGSFRKALPSALEDRLTTTELRLGDILPSQAEALIQSRLARSKVPPALARSFSAELNWPDFLGRQAREGAPCSPRAVLREAARCWREFWKPADQQGDSSPASSTGIPPSFLAGTGPGVVPAPRNPWQNPAEPFATELSAPLHSPVPAWKAGTAHPLRDPDPPPHAAPQRQPQSHPADFSAGNFAVSSGEPAWSFLPPLGNPVRPATEPSVFISSTPGPPRPPAEAPSGPASIARSADSSWTDGEALNLRFLQLRAHFAAMPGLVPEPARLNRLLRLSGENLAVVRLEEIAFTDGSSAAWRAFVWHLPDGGILFGTEPHRHAAYWTALLREAEHWNAREAGFRLVVFASASQPAPPGAGLEPEDFASARSRFLDLQNLSQRELATLHAVDEILQDTARPTAAAPLSAEKILAALAPWLEPFWKRLTRPPRRH